MFVTESSKTIEYLQKTSSHGTTKYAGFIAAKLWTPMMCMLIAICIGTQRGNVYVGGECLFDRQK